MADHRQFRAMDREYVCAEARWGSKSRGLPVHERIICRHNRCWKLGGKNAEQNIGPFDKVSAACDYHCRADFGY